MYLFEIMFLLSSDTYIYIYIYEWDCWVTWYFCLQVLEEFSFSFAVCVPTDTPTVVYRVPFSLYPANICYMCPLMIAILTDVRQYHTAVLIYKSLLICDTEHLLFNGHLYICFVNNVHSGLVSAL